MEEHFKIIKKEKAEFEPFDIEVSGTIHISSPEMALALYGVFNKFGCFDSDNTWNEYKRFLESIGLKGQATIDDYWRAYCESRDMDPKTGKKTGRI